MSGLEETAAIMTGPSLSSGDSVKCHIEVLPGVTPFLQMTWMSVCDCGWTGHRWSDKDGAKAEGNDHTGSEAS